jgi:hypothetical protein
VFEVTVFGAGVGLVVRLLGVVVTGGRVVATGGLVALGVSAVVRVTATDLLVLRSVLRLLLRSSTGVFRAAAVLVPSTVPTWGLSRWVSRRPRAVVL